MRPFLQPVWVLGHVAVLKNRNSPLNPGQVKRAFFDRLSLYGLSEPDFFSLDAGALLP